jgi:hypothetical protein
VTAVFEVPVTVAVNCWLCPGDRTGLVGEIETETATGCWTVTPAEAALVESAAEVAVTAKALPADDPAVNKPVLEIVPPVAVHATAVFALPVTAAENCRV